MDISITFKISFIKFKCYTENIFNTKWKTFQSDGGGEFTSHPFKHFLDSNGITHCILCPYSSQQNGVAERKYRHDIEAGLALLAHSHLTQSYRVKVFNTVVYLINYIPTPTLANRSSYSILLSQQPDYSLTRTFGCACYPLLRPYNNHKLMFRSKKYILS